MKQESLKKLKRNELLEIIVKQKKRIEELEERVRDIEQAEDQTVRLSISQAGSWSDTLRKLADMFDGGEDPQMTGVNDPASTGETIRQVQHEDLDWHTSGDAAKKTVPDKDYSFIDLDKIQWPSNR